MNSCFPSAHRSPKGAELVCPRLGLHDAGSRGQQREVVGVGRLVKVGDGAVRDKNDKEGWGDNGSLFGRWGRHL